MILSTIFPQFEDDFLFSVLEAHDGDLEKSKAYLLANFKSKASPAALEAMKPKKNEATKETIIHSNSILRLQKMWVPKPQKNF